MSALKPEPDEALQALMHHPKPSAHGCINGPCLVALMVQQSKWQHCDWQIERLHRKPIKSCKPEPNSESKSGW